MAKRDKLKRIYEFLVDNCDIDDLYLSPEYRDGDLTKPIPYSYGIISRDSYAIHAGNKYGPVLCGKGVCRGFSLAFQDIASKCNLSTRIIEGDHKGFKHGWIVTEENGEIYHIDVFCGIENKRAGKYKYEWFMKPADYFIRFGGHRDFEESLNSATQSLKNGYRVILNSNPARKLGQSNIGNHETSNVNSSNIEGFRTIRRR